MAADIKSSCEKVQILAQQQEAKNLTEDSDPGVYIYEHKDMLNIDEVVLSKVLVLADEMHNFTHKPDLLKKICTAVQLIGLSASLGNYLCLQAIEEKVKEQGPTPYIMDTKHVVEKTGDVVLNILKTPRHLVFGAANKSIKDKKIREAIFDILKKLIAEKKEDDRFLVFMQNNKTCKEMFQILSSENRDKTLIIDAMEKSTKKIMNNLGWLEIMQKADP